MAGFLSEKTKGAGILCAILLLAMMAPMAGTASGLDLAVYTRSPASAGCHGKCTCPAARLPGLLAGVVDVYELCVF